MIYSLCFGITYPKASIYVKGENFSLDNRVQSINGWEDVCVKVRRVFKFKVVLEYVSGSRKLQLLQLNSSIEFKKNDVQGKKIQATCQEQSENENFLIYVTKFFFSSFRSIFSVKSLTAAPTKNT